MDEARDNIQKAYELLGAVSVMGDGVELMAAAKECLRRAHKLLQNTTMPKASGPGQAVVSLVDQKPRA